MKPKNYGQSLVEMALIGPLLLFILFGIIDMGYFIYSYATLYQAARNASEVASALAPHPSVLPPENGDQLDRRDSCVCKILESIQEDAILFPDMASNATIVITYPYQHEMFPYNPKNPVEITIGYKVKPLTPFWDMMPLFGTNTRDEDYAGFTLTMTATSRRTIQTRVADQENADQEQCHVKDTKPLTTPCYISASP